MGREHRTAARYVFVREIQIGRGDQHLVGETEDLSLGGAMVKVAADPPFAMGEKVRLSFTLPALPDPVEVDAAVRWTRKGAHDSIGFQFSSGLRAKQVWAMNQLFAKLKEQV